MTTRLQPLTPAEITRMRNLYASGPLYTGGNHEATDAALTAKGWIMPYETFDTEDAPSVVPSDAAYRKDGSGCCLYDDKGGVCACWKA